MKRIFILIALSALAFSMQASHYTGTVVLRAAQSPITVRVNGVQNHQSPAPKQILEDVPEGRHFVEVFEYPAYRPGNWTQNGRLIFRGYLTAESGMRSVYEVYRNRLTLVKQQPLNPPVCQQHGQHPCSCVLPPRGCQGHGNGHGYGHGNGNGHGHNCGVQQDYGYYGTPPSQPWGYNPVPHGYPGQYYGGFPSTYHHGLDDRTFRLVLQKMGEEITDVNKVAAATRIIGEQTVSTEQVQTLMEALSFDAQKWSLAKALYPNVSDPEHYGELSSALYFTTYKRQLEEMLYAGR